MTYRLTWTKQNTAIAAYSLRICFILCALALFFSPTPLEFTPKVHAAQIALNPTSFASITFSQPAVSTPVSKQNAEKQLPKEVSTTEIKRPSIERQAKVADKKPTERKPEVQEVTSAQTTEATESKSSLQQEPTGKQKPTEQTVSTTARETTLSKTDTTDEVALVKQPLFREAPKAPYYPPLARRRGIEGTVILEVWIDEYGQQTDLRIHESSGKDVLDVSAVQAVENWRFQAHSINGLNVASRVQIPVRFALN